MNFRKKLKAIFIKWILLFKYIFQSNSTEIIEFRIASSDDELKKTYRLRYEVYCLEKGYLNPENYSEKQEIDEFDKRSGTASIIAIDRNNIIIGMMRIVPNDLYNPELPSESYYSLKEYRKYNKNIAELSRFIISKTYRKNIRIYFGLVKGAMLYAKKCGINNFCISVSTLFTDRYLIFGFKKVSGPYFYSKINHQCPSFTMCLNINKAAENMNKMNPAFSKYLTKKTPEIKI
ncbi:MAG: GNAT family N-acyltransferase [Patescibacteria group bacterium]|nr:GNAT family N-acyltransferase [Patescibacteria group bacterium]